jgi:hypothetical protein
MFRSLRICCNVFWTTNAHATFMTLIKSLFRDHMDKSILMFMDDILMYSKNVEEHKQHLKQIFEI